MKIYNQSLTCGDRKNFEAIDLMKFICAILVVSIHVSPFGQDLSVGLSWVNRLVRNYIARLAVPFFFMCTGFLMFRKVDMENFSIRNTAGQIKKAYRLYFLYVLIYAGPIIYRILTDEKGALYGAIVFLRNLIFTGGYTHLWYLNGLGLALLLISLLLHRGMRFSRILLLAFALHLVGLLLLPYYGLIEPLKAYPLAAKALKLFALTFATPRNGLFFGFFYICLGALFARKSICMSMGRAVLGFGISMLLLLAEILILVQLDWAKGYDFYLFLAPASFFLFYIVTHIELKPRPVYRYLRISSSLVFFLHLLVVWVLNDMLPYAGIDIRGTWLAFPLNLLFTLLSAHAVIRLSARPGCAWLKQLYS